MHWKSKTTSETKFSLRQNLRQIVFKQKNLSWTGFCLGLNFVWDYIQYMIFRIQSFNFICWMSLYILGRDLKCNDRKHLFFKFNLNENCTKSHCNFSLCSRSKIKSKSELQWLNGHHSRLPHGRPGFDHQKGRDARQCLSKS